MPWTIPVYDRVLADVTNKTSKGFWNVVDWVRIHGNTAYVSALISVLRVIDVDLTAVSTPTITTFPTAADINDFVQNIEKLRLAIGLPVSTDIVSLTFDYDFGGSSDTPDWSDVNDWEKNLYNLKKFLVNSSYYEVFCGVALSGQIRFYQSRWRTPWVRDSDTPVRRPRCGIAGSGIGAMRNNKFRRYS